MKVWIFFSFAKLQNGHSWHQTTQQPGFVSLKLSSHDLLSEMQNSTQEGRRMLDAECNLHGVRVISFPKDKSSYKRVLGTAKQ